MYPQLKATLSSCNRVSTDIIMLSCVLPVKFTCGCRGIYSKPHVCLTELCQKTQNKTKKKGEDLILNPVAIIFLLHKNRH